MHYHHSIEAKDIDATSIGFVCLDLDGDILTGFQNAGGVFPTFGVDLLIHYELYSRSVGDEPQISLVVQDPEKPAEQMKIAVGSYLSDASYLRKGNKLEVSIPLAFVPPISDAAIIRASSMAELKGLFDNSPDNGGFRLRDGSIRPFNAPQSRGASVTDPAGDSYGLSKDNDDIVELTAGFCPEGLLLTVKYTELDLFGRSMTGIFLDTDRNRSTGDLFRGPEPPGDNPLGVEWSLVYQVTSLLGGSPGGNTVGTKGAPKALIFNYDGGAGSIKWGTVTLFLRCRRVTARGA